jgi:hypothetical protein
MPAVSRIVAFALMGLLLSLPALGADEKDKKADPPKQDAKKADVKKEEPAKKDVKKDEPAKKDADKNDAGKKVPAMKMPAKMPVRKGKFAQLESDPEAAYKKMLMKSPKVQATVMAVVEDKKSLRLKVTVPYVRINQGQLQNYINAQNSMLQASNAQGVINAQNQMAQAAAQLYELATVDKEVEWTAADEIKVRMNNPPPQFDDKGRVKRYTAKELRELKGNDRLPGYPAEFSDIKTGQIVQVTLEQKKIAPRPVKRGKEAEGEPLGDNLPKMTFLVIVAEPKN